MDNDLNEMFREYIYFAIEPYDSKDGLDNPKKFDGHWWEADAFSDSVSDFLENELDFVPDAAMVKKFKKQVL